MGQKNLDSIRCFVLLFFGVVSAQKCVDTAGFFRPNTTYDTNRQLILSALVSNVTARGGYYNGSIGQGPDTVYALGLCIPGTRPEVCSDCIQPAVNGLLSNCPNQTSAFDWRADKTLCLVRYSNISFFGSIELEPRQQETINLDVSGNLTEFNTTWNGFMQSMIDATTSATSPGRKYYAADVKHLTDFQSIYALMQCIPGLSPGDCDACLRANVRDYQSCCGGKQGGSIRRPICFFRWDMYPYLGAFDIIASSPPLQPTPSPDDRPDTTTTEDGKTISAGTIVGIVVPTVIIMALLALGFVVWRRRKSYRRMELETDDDITAPHSLQFDFKTIEAATNQFSHSNRLGQGGFGDVYKGTLPNGSVVAVKRLSKTSGQGDREFKNEVVLLAKLQHRNLVRLLGFCLEGEEKILVYEFVPNKSLDYFLFDRTKQEQLNWTRRHRIIVGIARGILYLHQDSRLTIIHRDLKASNVLLDSDLNPKIADFGMARLFGMDQTRANTSRIVGTYGYMSPEYAMHGQFSMKSDVYSFGVLVLEIISGKMNSSFYQREGTAGNLVTHAWRLWRNGLPLELVDPAIGDNYQSNEVTRYIHIALLCVQENPADRPPLSTIILMLTSNSITLPVPRQPGFFLQSRQDQEPSVVYSVDDASITDLDPR
ncbi:PREDICTED: cysteine-rich receptor-like protein kinase 11 [Tarenaya hassleriana]|uniref:cysteine-rich receptor-like protein kinase 11 n=1 Tax=Tarenaya hassleriana TaxID=28532 RepID=UPI00053C1B02|nr:PREDICTED: cysteine-rich receptor-like protein kinase 11 [Tarenaya hassleriana]